MASGFDRVTKCAFNGPNTPCYVKFGGLNYNDPEFDIRSGSIKITGTQIASFFEPALQDIVQAVKRQRHKSTVTIKTVLLVGGFARSDYLFSQLSSHLTRGISLIRPDTTHLNKAVADGAVSYYLDHYVTARVSKYSYGLMINVPFDPMDPEHARRSSAMFMQADGNYYIPCAFSTILKKDTEVSEQTRFRQSYMVLSTPEKFSRWTGSKAVTLKCYRGEAESPPEWTDLEPNAFHNMCVIKADMTNAKKNMNSKYKPSTNKRYYQSDHDVEMLFGLTELKAYVTWKENGVEKRSEAVVVYDN
ncbi:hypothetical protein JOM56_007872 [Amanita muscaria]